MFYAINSATPAIAKFIIAFSISFLNPDTKGLCITRIVAIVKAYKAIPASCTEKNIKADDASSKYPMNVMI